MARILAAGISVVLVAAVLVVALAETHEARGQPTDTPTPTESATPTVSATATATATPTSAASASATRTSTASPVQPAAVPETGGEPTDGSLSLALMIALGTGAIAGTAGLFAASYALTRRS